MPSKKKRVASRQAQLSQRRRRERNRERRTDPAPGPAVGPRTMPAVPTSDEVANGANDAAAPAPVRVPAAATPGIRQPALTRQPGRTRRRGAAARVEPVPTYRHLGSEVRHIGIITGIIVALLTVLTIIMR